MASPSVSYEADYLRWLEDRVSHLRAGELDRLDREHLLEAFARGARRHESQRASAVAQSADRPGAASCPFTNAEVLDEEYWPDTVEGDRSS